MVKICKFVTHQYTKIAEICQNGYNFASHQYCWKCNQNQQHIQLYWLPPPPPFSQTDLDLSNSPCHYTHINTIILSTPPPPLQLNWFASFKIHLSLAYISTITYLPTLKPILICEQILGIPLQKKEHSCIVHHAKFTCVTWYITKRNAFKEYCSFCLKKKNQKILIKKEQLAGMLNSPRVPSWTAHTNLWIFIGYPSPSHFSHTDLCIILNSPCPWTHINTFRVPHSLPFSHTDIHLSKFTLSLNTHQYIQSTPSPLPFSHTDIHLSKFTLSLNTHQYIQSTPPPPLQSYWYSSF